MARETYTHGYHDSVLASHRWRRAENSAAYLLGRLVPGDTLLDVGCGPGTITADLARRVAPGRVTGVDVHASLVEAARDATEGVANVDFATGDAYALGFADASFDVVHAHQVLQHLADPVAALAEMGRVCRDGGLVAVREADYGAMSWYPPREGLTRFLEIYRAAARANGGEPDAGRRLLSWAHAAGFTDVEVSSSTWCFATPADRAFWGGTWAERVVSSSLAETARREGLATDAELEAAAAAFRAFAADEDAVFTVVHGEILARATHLGPKRS